MAGSHRGVWLAPWQGPRGEFVAYSIDSQSQLVHAPEIIPHGADRVAFADRLWEELDRVDPVRSPITVLPPSFRRLPRSLQRRGLQLLR